VPHFDPFYADKLRGPLGAAEADAVLDLSGRSAAEAEAAIRDMLERSRFAQRSTLAVKLSPPPEGGGETLFQPVGRQLLDARKRDWIEHLHTLPGRDGLGFFVVLAGRPSEG
jgi:hypothetical protein